jgi:TetR/AcrR family transcriptional regulator, transcriptional repressor for nem operon
MRSWALTALATHIRDGVAAGEMGDVDPEEAAHFLLAVRSGLKVATRSGAGFDALRAIAQMTLRSLRA